MLRPLFKAFALVCIFAASFTPSLASPDKANYEAAQRSYEAQFNSEQQLLLQVLLISAGYSNAVPNQEFNHRTFTALQHFQNDSGLPPTGAPDKTTVGRLVDAAAPMMEQWGFRKVTLPSRSVTILIPIGLGLVSNRIANGLAYQDPQQRLMISFLSFPRVSLRQTYALLLAHYVEEGATIHYRVMKDNWFVISLTSPSGIDGYLRYYQDGSSVTGFTENWNNANGNVHGERIAVLMSASISSAMTGAPFIDLSEPNSTSQADANSQNAAVKPPEPPAAQKPSEKKDMFSSGTAFFVTQDGTLVTNAHVISDCSDIRIKTKDGTISPATIVARDSTNDLAIIKAENTHSDKIAKLRLSVRLGEGVAVFGFPHVDILASSGNFTLGNVTALSGMGDDSRFIQISAPVQSGNSGGPLLDQNGNLIGVVTSKLNAIKMAVNQGDLPQNVNFAVKSVILASFLDSNRISYQAGTDTIALQPPDLADRARDISAFVVCK